MIQLSQTPWIAARPASAARWRAKSHGTRQIQINGEIPYGGKARMISAPERRVSQSGRRRRRILPLLLGCKLALIYFQLSREYGLRVYVDV